MNVYTYVYVYLCIKGRKIYAIHSQQLSSILLYY